MGGGRIDRSPKSGYTEAKEVIILKKQDLLSLLQLLLVPVLLIVLGLCLLVNPDWASAMVSRILGYAMILGAVGVGISAIYSPSGKVSRGVLAAMLAVFGGWLVSHPLVLAAWIGRVVGVLIFINSGMELYYGLKSGANPLFHGGACLFGILLILLPMTASRLVFSLCGAVVAVIGVVMLLDRIRSRRWLTGGDDPNIIDAL